MNGIYLYLLLKEIREDLIGSHVKDVRVRGRSIQVLLHDTSLIISLYPTGLGLFLSDEELRGYDSLRNISDVIKSCQIVEVLQQDYMPVTNIILERTFPEKQRIELIISFYPEAPNFSLRTRDWQRNVFPRYVEKKAKIPVTEIEADQLAHATADYIVKNIEGIDKKMARELSTENLKSLNNILQGKIIQPKLVSAVPLHISLFDRKYEAEYASFNEVFKAAVTRFLVTRERRAAEQQKRSAIRNIKRRIARLQKKILSSEEIEDIRIKGELIFANIGKIGKGSVQTKVFNPYTQRDMQIRLDPKLSPQANAQRYFSRYKKEKRGQPKLREQIMTLSKELNDVAVKLPVEVKEEKKLSSKILLKEPFHKFVLDSGSVVLVGKNARSNDELTFKYARPNDYFFHTRGFEGAHTLLRPNIPRGQRPRREDVKMAASIAAYFSKAKKQHNVPVSYTQRKYLRKNKKGKRGSVVLMREEVIFVEPGLPYL